MKAREAELLGMKATADRVKVYTEYSWSTLTSLFA